MKSTLRLMLLLSSCIAAGSAMAQNQAYYADANGVSAAAVPGYSFRVDLKVAPDATLFWEFKIKGTDGLGHLTRVSVPSLVLKRNVPKSIDRDAPSTGLDPVMAGMNAVSAAQAKFGDTQIVRFEAKPRSHGDIRYRVLLNILNDGGGVLDQDLEVTLDANGNVIKIQQNDD